MCRTGHGYLSIPNVFYFAAPHPPLLPPALTETGAPLAWRIPLASTSNATSTWGVPRGAGGIPESSNFPRRRLSRVMERSPSNTWEGSNQGYEGTTPSITILMRTAVQKCPQNVLENVPKKFCIFSRLNEHARLVIRVGRKTLRLAGGNRGSPLDQLGHHAASCLRANRGQPHEHFNVTEQAYVGTH